METAKKIILFSIIALLVLSSTVVVSQAYVASNEKYIWSNILNKNNDLEKDSMGDILSNKEGIDKTNVETDPDGELDTSSQKTELPNSEKEQQQMEDPTELESSQSSKIDESSSSNQLENFKTRISQFVNYFERHNANNGAIVSFLYRLLGEEQLGITAPTYVNENIIFSVIVRCNGTRIEGATVTFNNIAMVTDFFGQVNFIAPEVNNNTWYTITAEKEGYQNIERYILVKNVEYELTVETDRLIFYRGEDVIISGKLTRDGIGIPGEVCIEVFDPSNYPDFLNCTMVNQNGNYSIVYSIGSNASVGTYIVNAENTLYNVSAFTPFSVLYHLVADAHGPYNGIVGEEVIFTGSATGGNPLYYWLWEFGDGTTSTLRNPGHIYNSTGIFNVTLTVTDRDNNTDIDTTTTIIEDTPDYGLTVETNKLIFYRGEDVIISGNLTGDGIGIPGEICIEVFDPSNYPDFLNCTMANQNGDYSVVYSIGSNASVGTYIVNAENTLYNVSAFTPFQVLNHSVGDITGITGFTDPDWGEIEFQAVTEGNVSRVVFYIRYIGSEWMYLGHVWNEPFTIEWSDSLPRSNVTIKAWPYYLGVLGDSFTSEPFEYLGPYGPTVIDPYLSSFNLTGESTSGMTTCPIGDGPAYKYATVIVRDTYGNPIEGILAGNFLFSIDSTNTTQFFNNLSCSFITNNTMTDENGMIRFEIIGDTSIIGDIQIQVTVDEVVIMDIETLSCISPDYSVDGNVGLADFVLFARDFRGLYNSRSDFDWNGVMNLGDFVIFAKHFGH